MKTLSTALSIARSAIVVPFEATAAHPSGALADKLLRRRYSGRKAKADVARGATHAVWEKATKAPIQIRELTPGLQAILDVDDAGVTRSRNSQSWQDEVAANVRNEASCTFLRLGQRLIDALQTMTLIHASEHTSTRLCDIQCAVYPSGNGYLALYIDWQVDGDALSLEQLESRLAWIRQVKSNPKRYQLAFEGHSGFAERLKQAGEEGLAVALSGERLGASELLQALINNNVSNSYVLSASRYVAHHTFAQLNGTVDAEGPGVARLLREHSFRLRRAYSYNYAASGDLDSADIEFMQRKNRMVGVAREGSAVLAWRCPETNEAGQSFEDEQYPDIFVGTMRKGRVTPGLYFLLHAHARFERAELDRLSGRVSWSGELSRGPRFLGEKPTYKALSAMIKRLSELRERIFAHTTTMTYPDCGGISDYAAFYRAQRSVFCSDEALGEIRAKLQDIDSALARASESMERKFEIGVSYGLALLGTLALPPAYVPILRDVPLIKTMTGGHDSVLLALLSLLVGGLAVLIYLLARRR